MKHAFKKTLAFLLVLVMVIGVLPSVFAANVGPFTDVKDTDWFAPHVKYVYEHDPQLMNGVTTTTFAPNDTCTRAMAAVVLYRLADPVIPSVKPSTFTDLTQDWYKNGVAWAEHAGVVNGVGGNRFDPNGKVTREQLVTMMWRYAGKPEVKEDHLKKFPDANRIADYAKPAFNWAISKNIINGSDGKLLPKDNATRAQFAKIIAVFVDVTTPCTEHKWDEGKVTKEPTCTEEGEKVYTCTRCGETKTEAVPALGHNYVDGVCTVCGEKLADKDEIVIYYTNDVHTYIDGALSYDNIADLKAQTAKIAAGVLLLDAGDHIQGTAYGSMDKGGKIIEMMNAAGYDAATLGNHEFDYGMERALELIGKADYPYLSANFYHEKDGVAGENVLDAYKVFEVGGKKIAVVGITTPESFTKSTPKYFQDETGKYIYGIAGGTDGAALYASVQTAVDAAKAAGVDYVIALGHCGDDPASKPWTSEEVIANTTGIDAFIDGHSHSTVPMREVKAKDGKTVVLTQTGSYFGAIGRMSITKDGIKSELITTNTGSDKTVAGIKNAWIAEIDTKLGEVIGHADVTLDNYDKDGNRLVRKQETNTGDFAADALYYLFDVTNPLDVDMAIMNGGGVRNKAITGDISYKTCKEIHTFGNVACLIEVTGQQILDALEWGARDATPEGNKECGGFLQVSGATYEIHTYIPNTVQKDEKGVWTGGPTGEYRVKNVKINGEPLDLAKTYRLAGYNYTLRDMGDGFAMFNGAKNVLDYVMEDYMVLANYVKSFPVNATTELPTIGTDSKYADVNGEGRITLVNEKPDTPTPTNEYVLTSELKDGDKVVIYNPGYKKALSNQVIANYYLAGSDTLPTDNKYVDPDASIVWDVKVVDGGIELSNNGNKLSMGDGTYHSIPLNDANATWKVTAATTEGCVYITNTGRDEMLEWYDTKNEFSAIGYREANEAMFAMQLYVLTEGGDVPGPGPEPTGEYVAIYNPANSVVMTTEVSTYTGSSGTKDQLLPADATLADGKLTTTATNVALFEIITTDGVTTFKTEDGKYLYADGTNLRLADTESEYTRFVLEDTEGGQFIRCETAQAYNKAQYIEYYASKSVFTLYGMGSDTTIYTFAFYPLAGGEQPHVHAWDEGKVTKEATCTEAGVMTYTCECGETKTEVIPMLDHVDADNDNKCDVCGADMGAAPQVMYVAIYNPANSVVMTTEVSTYTGSSGTKDQMLPADATLADGKLTTTATNVALFEIITTDGVTTFKTEDGKYLYADGENLRLADTESEYTRFVLEDTEGGQFIRCETAQAYNKAQYIEYYASKSVFTVYGMGSDTTIYTFAFYPLAGGDQPAPHEHVWGEGVVTKEATCTEEGVKTYTCECGETKTEAIAALGHIDADNDNKCDRCGIDMGAAPAADEYVLTNELKDGDKVVIVNTAESQALSSEIIKTYYKAGLAVTPADGKIVDPDETIVWTVTADGEGFNLATVDGKKLSIDGTYNSIPYDKGYDAWSVTAATTENSVYVVNENGKYLCWSSYGNFSAGVYDAANEGYYALQIYVLTKSGDQPHEHHYGEGEVTKEATCTEDGVMTYTCECGETKTEVIAALGHIDADNDNKCDRCGIDMGTGTTGKYVVADSFAAGDKIVIVATYGTDLYAMSNMVANSLAEGVAVTATDNELTNVTDDLVWTLVAGADGKYYLTVGDQQLGVSKGNLSLSNAGGLFTVTASSVICDSTTDRCLLLQMYNGAPRFKNYATSNIGGSNYASAITVYKYVEG